jgi:hypothetical protein
MQVRYLRWRLQTRWWRCTTVVRVSTPEQKNGHAVGVRGHVPANPKNRPATHRITNRAESPQIAQSFRNGYGWWSAGQHCVFATVASRSNFYPPRYASGLEPPRHRVPRGEQRAGERSPQNVANDYAFCLCHLDEFQLLTMTDHVDVAVFRHAARDPKYSFIRGEFSMEAHQNGRLSK